MASIMSPLVAWLVLIVFYLLPIAHVALSPRGGPWRMPPGARCPFSPRVGWLLYLRGRRAAGPPASS